MTRLDLMNQAPEGTAVPLTGQAGVFAVRGSKSWYRCDATKGECSCCDWLYRRAETRTPCKHLRALGQYLLIAELVKQQFEHPAAAPEMRPAVPTPERPGQHVRAAPESDPLPSDAELREIFA